MKKRLLSITIIISCVTIVSLLIVRVMKNNQTGKINTISFFALDTNVTINVYDQLNNIDEILNKTKDLVYSFEKILSKTVEGSDIYNINDNNDGTYIEISLDTAYLFKMSKEFYELSNHKFDISIGRLVDYWTKLRNEKIKPDISDIEKYLQTTNNMDFELYYDDGNMHGFDKLYESIIRDGIQNYVNEIDSLKNNYDYKYYIRLKKNDQSYDLGAIAKGYIADYVKYYLIKNDVRSAIINLGGNVLCIGNKYDKDFVIGIKKPFYEDEIIDKVNIDNESVTTSGVYERYIKFNNDERIYHHIIDNKTGFPTDNELLSATVITPLSVIGDCISTICILNGINDTREIIDRLKSLFKIECDVIYIDNNYNIIK